MLFSELTAHNLQLFPPPAVFDDEPVNIDPWDQCQPALHQLTQINYKLDRSTGTPGPIVEDTDIFRK